MKKMKGYKTIIKNVTINDCNAMNCPFMVYGVWNLILNIFYGY